MHRAVVGEHRNLVIRRKRTLQRTQRVIDPLHCVERHRLVDHKRDRKWKRIDGKQTHLLPLSVLINPDIAPRHSRNQYVLRVLHSEGNFYKVDVYRTQLERRICTLARSRKLWHRSLIDRSRRRSRSRQARRRSNLVVLRRRTHVRGRWCIRSSRSYRRNGVQVRQRLRLRRVRNLRLRSRRRRSRRTLSMYLEAGTGQQHRQRHNPYHLLARTHPDQPFSFVLLPTARRRTHLLRLPATAPLRYPSHSIRSSLVDVSGAGWSCASSHSAPSTRQIPAHHPSAVA